MHISEVRAQVQAEPFVPFRIHMTDGSSFDVPHPEFVILAKWAVHLAVEWDEHRIAERVTRLAIGHISRIEELDTAPSS